MKFYINNNELSEKVFWRTLDSLVSPIQRVHILDGMKVKIADYLCWIEIPTSFLFSTWLFIGSALQTTNSVDNAKTITFLFFILSSSPFIHHLFIIIYFIYSLDFCLLIIKFTISFINL